MGFLGGDAKDHWKESFDDMARDRSTLRIARVKWEA